MIAATEPRSCRLVALVALGALAAHLGHAAPALAQTKDPAAAEALFREGRALSDAGDIAGACSKFRESDRLDPAIGTTFNIADCEERLGHLARAWTLYGEVAQRLPANDKRRALAEKRVAALEPRLPKLSIRLAAGAPAESRVVRDGVELGSASQGTPLPVDPGLHSIVVSAPGRSDKELKVMVSEREYRTLEVEPGPPSATSAGAPTPTPPPDVRLASGGGRSPVLGYVLGGIGVAGFVTGAIAGALVLQKKGVVDEHCDDDKQCDAEGLEATKSGKTLGLVTTVGLVTGVVGVGTGTYLILSAGSSRDPGAASFSVRGRF